MDAADDEIFKLTTKGGELTLEREKVRYTIAQEFRFFFLEQGT